MADSQPAMCRSLKSMGNTDTCAANEARQSSWLMRLRKWMTRAGRAVPSRTSEAAPEPVQDVADCLTEFDNGVRSAQRAWEGGALASKVNPSRVERVLDALASRDPQAIVALVVEIAAPDNAVSPVTTLTSVNNPMREQFVRGVMGAVLAAIVEVEMAYDSDTPSASALLARLRRWIGEPAARQEAGERTLDHGTLSETSDTLCRIAEDVLASYEGSARDAACARLGIVAPIGVALQLIAMQDLTDRAGREVAPRPQEPQESTQAAQGSDA